MTQFQDFSTKHPAHIAYLDDVPRAKLSLLFDLLNRLDADKRDKMMFLAYLAIINPGFRSPVSSRQTLGDLMMDELDYDTFKQRCYIISESLSERILVFTTVAVTLQGLFHAGNPNFSGLAQERRGHMADIMRRVIDYKLGRGGMSEEEYASHAMSSMSVEDLQKSLAKWEAEGIALPQTMKDNYALYEEFCNTVVIPLMTEPQN